MDRTTETLARYATSLRYGDLSPNTLKEVKYDGWLTIEAFGRALPDLAAATRIWRDLFPSAEDVYTKGIAFIKSRWGR